MKLLFRSLSLLFGSLIALALFMSPAAARIVQIGAPRIIKTNTPFNVTITSRKVKAGFKPYDITLLIGIGRETEGNKLYKPQPIGSLYKIIDLHTNYYRPTENDDTLNQTLTIYANYGDNYSGKGWIYATWLALVKDQVPVLASLNVSFTFGDIMSEDYAYSPLLPRGLASDY